MWTIYRHYKGRHYLGVDAATHSESLEALQVYRCLYDTERGPTWARPSEMFHALHADNGHRFEPVARVRVVFAEDRDRVLRFGYDAWGDGRSEDAFVASYDGSRNELMGTRYLLELRDATIVATMNTLRLARGVIGIASVATRPTHRRRGHATRLLLAVMSIFRLEDPSTRFLLFSEVDPNVYRPCGFAELPAEQQFFPGKAIAMATGGALGPEHVGLARTYF